MSLKNLGINHRSGSRSGLHPTKTSVVPAFLPPLLRYCSSMFRTLLSQVVERGSDLAHISRHEKSCFFVVDFVGVRVPQMFLLPSGLKVLIADIALAGPWDDISRRIEYCSSSSVVFDISARTRSIRVHSSTSAMLFFHIS